MMKEIGSQSGKMSQWYCPYTEGELQSSRSLSAERANRIPTERDYCRHCFGTMYEDGEKLNGRSAWASHFLSVTLPQSPPCNITKE